MAKTWKPGTVVQLVERAGADSSRPEGLPSECGLQGDQYRLSQAQVDAILELRLHRLTGLEQDKIFAEYQELLNKIAELIEILADVNRLMQVIREELAEIKADFGDERRTEITASQHDMTIEDLIAEEERVVTLSNTGYIKSQPLADYQAQRRGGRGKSATSLKEEDFVEKLAIASTHAMMLCFSSTGKVYWKKVYEFPLASRQSRGRPIVNLLPLEEGESITAMLAVREFDADHFVFMATANGTVKKTPLEAFSRPRANGIWAINLADDDALIGVALTDGEKEIMLFSDAGKAVRFTEDNVRAMGRTAAGVRGIRLQDQQKVMSLISTSGGEEGDILTATENGYGKRTKLDEYRLVNRGAQGVMSIQTTERNGRVIGAALVHENDEVMLITNGGTMVRTRATEISLIGRNTQGVRLIRLTEGEQLVSVKRIVDLDDADAEDETEVNEDGISPSA